MGEMRTLSEEGDLRLRWDPDKPDEVAKARAEFDRMKKAGYLFFQTKRFSRKPGPQVKAFAQNDGVLIADFKPEADAIIAAPAPRGG